MGEEISERSAARTFVLSCLPDVPQSVDAGWAAEGLGLRPHRHQEMAVEFLRQGAQQRSGHRIHRALFCDAGSLRVARSASGFFRDAITDTRTYRNSDARTGPAEGGHSSRSLLHAEPVTVPDDERDAFRIRLTRAERLTGSYSDSQAVT